MPLLYQKHQELLENTKYEDFISYQATNENMESYLKEILNKRKKILAKKQQILLIKIKFLQVKNHLNNLILKFLFLK